MTSVTGGTTWVPSEQNLDDVLFRFVQLRDWIKGTMIPDTLAIAPFYLDALSYGAGVGNFLAWVFLTTSLSTRQAIPALRHHQGPLALRGRHVEDHRGCRSRVL